MLRVVLAFEQAIERDGLTLLLKNIQAVSVLAEAANGHEAELTCRVQQPDVLLIDPELPVVDGATVTRRLRHQFPRLRVLAIGDSVQPETVARQLAAGAGGYLSKQCHQQELVAAIQADNTQPAYLGHDVDISGLSDAEVAGAMPEAAATCDGDIPDVPKKP